MKKLLVAVLLLGLLLVVPSAVRAEVSPPPGPLAFHPVDVFFDGAWNGRATTNHLGWWHYTVVPSVGSAAPTVDVLTDPISQADGYPAILGGGVLTDPFRPLPNVTVRILEEDNSGTYREIAQLLTDPNGDFEFPYVFHDNRAVKFLFDDIPYSRLVGSQLHGVLALQAR